MIYLKTSVGVEIRQEDLLISSLQSNLSAGVFTHFTCIPDFRSRGRQEVRGEIDAFFKSTRLSRENIVLGLPRRDTVVRHLDLPAEVSDNLKQVVLYQVQAFEPTEEERSYFDFVRLPGPKDGKRLSVLLVMVKKSLLDSQLEVLRELGIRPIAVTGGSLALTNLFLQSRPETLGKTFFLADVTESGLELLAVRNGALVYTLASAKPEGTAWKELLFQAVDKAVAKIGMEPEDTIEQILLAGEGAQLVHQEVQEEMPDCSLIGSLIRFEAAPYCKTRLQQAGSSLGLAYTGLARRPALYLNLLPSELKITQTRWAYVPTIVLGISILVLLTSMGFRQMAQERVLIRQLDQEIESLNAPVSRVQTVRTQAENLEKRVVMVEGLLRQRYMNLEVLQELTSILPTDTFLTVYQNRQGTISISGSSSSAEKLIPLLENSPLLKDVTQRGTMFRDVQTGKDRFTFEMKLEK